MVSPKEIRIHRIMVRLHSFPLCVLGGFRAAECRTVNTSANVLNVRSDLLSGSSGSHTSLIQQPYGQWIVIRASSQTKSQLSRTLIRPTSSKAEPKFVPNRYRVLRPAKNNAQPNPYNPPCDTDSPSPKLEGGTDLRSRASSK